MLLNYVHAADEWDKRFIRIADEVASWSKDSTKVGAVLVRDRRILGTGYNGFPMGVDDDVPDRHERPAKYLYTVHAEINAIVACVQAGHSPVGAILYLNWEPTPCANCMKELLAFGIRDFRGYKSRVFGNPNKWGPEFEASKNMMNEVSPNVTVHSLLDNK